MRRGTNRHTDRQTGKTGTQTRVNTILFASSKTHAKCTEVAINRLNSETILIPLDRGRFVSAFNFVAMPIVDANILIRMKFGT